jgi:hypothetical protein
METTYILTAEMNGESFAWLDGLRREHFPPERNFLSAHLTLFHRLSAAQVAKLGSLEMPRAPVVLHFDHVALLGFGSRCTSSLPSLNDYATNYESGWAASSRGRTVSRGNRM